MNLSQVEGMVSESCCCFTCDSRQGMMEVVALFRAPTVMTCSPDNTRLNMDLLAKWQQSLHPIPVLWHHVQQKTAFVSIVFFSEHQQVAEPTWLCFTC